METLFSKMFTCRGEKASAVESIINEDFYIFRKFVLISHRTLYIRIHFTAFIHFLLTLQLKRREEDGKAVGAAIENDANSGATRKSTSSGKEDETVENENEQKREKGDTTSDNETAQVFGKVEVGKEEDPTKKIFIRKDFTHDDIHHFVPISISGRGRSRGGSSMYTTKGRRWVDEWKERNAVLKAGAERNIGMKPPSDAVEYKQGYVNFVAVVRLIMSSLL